MQLILSIWKNKHNPWIAAAILIIQVVVELPNIGHFDVPTSLGKVTKVFPFTPSGLDMAFNRSVHGGYFYPHLLPDYHMRVNTVLL